MKTIVFVAALAAFAVPTHPVAAQDPLSWNPAQLEVTRTELEERLSRLEQVASSSGYSRGFRNRAAQDAELIRQRLTEGDFRVGDRVLLSVEGEASIPDTLPVQPGPQVTLPIIGAISLHGVLRSELEQHLTAELGRYIQNPVVHARSLVRVSVLGSVGAPGFYTLPSDMILEEVIMSAGGPGANAVLDNIRIERRDERLWEGERLRDAMNQGITLDQLNVRAGDEIFIPERGRNLWWAFGRAALIVGSTVFFGIRLYNVF